jgi:hypothetical protein
VSAEQLVEFRVTFGAQYPRVPHPSYSKAHRDGWLAVFAHDESEARRLVTDYIGTEWAFLYRVDEISWHHWPLGELGRIRSTTAPVVRPSAANSEGVPA